MGADMVAVDEIQLCADPERGHVFTDRLLRMRGTHETLFLGAETMRGPIAALVPGVEFLRRERLSYACHAVESAGANAQAGNRTGPQQLGWSDVGGELQQARWLAIKRSTGRSTIATVAPNRPPLLDIISAAIAVIFRLQLQRDRYVAWTCRRHYAGIHSNSTTMTIRCRQRRAYRTHNCHRGRHCRRRYRRHRRRGAQPRRAPRTPERSSHVFQAQRVA